MTERKFEDLALEEIEMSQGCPAGTCCSWVVSTI